MKLSYTLILTIFALGFYPILAPAQYNAVTKPTHPGECTDQFFSDVQNAYRMRIYGQSGPQAEKNLQRILELCPDTPNKVLIQSEITTLGEEYAEHSLLLAKYYLKVFQEKGNGLKGSQSRLRLIEEKVPKFSKLDEVLFLLGKTYTFEDNFDEAEKYFRKTIKEFPKSKFRNDAKNYLRSIKQNRKHASKNT